MINYYYTIISINDDRKAYKDYIRRVVKAKELKLGPGVDGNLIPDEEWAEEFRKRGLELKPQWSNAKRGELGVWLSNFDRWHLASVIKSPLVVFEDDAVPDAYFDEKLENVLNELPEDWDFIALWVPENQRQDYYYDVKYNENGHPAINGVRPPEYSYYKVDGAAYAALVYQGYGMVSLMYSPAGGQKLIDLARSRGIDTPVDCWIFEEAHKGNLKGYAPRPEQASIVHYDWKAESHVQLTERLK